MLGTVAHSAATPARLMIENLDVFEDLFLVLSCSKTICLKFVDVVNSSKGECKSTRLAVA